MSGKSSTEGGPSSARPRRQPGHLVRLVKKRLGAHFVVDAAGHADGDRFVVAPARLLELVVFLQRDPDADLCLLVDIAGVDRGADAESDGPRAAARSRFEVHVQLRSPRLGYRAHIVVPVPPGEPTVPSLTPLFAAADTMERELHEMFGIYPDGHPRLRPVLLYPGFVGHPLRKDYRAGKQQPLVAMLDAQEHPPPIIPSPPPPRGQP